MAIKMKLMLCVSVPLVLAVVMSAVLWDVLCVSCSAEGRWQAAIRVAAKDQVRPPLRQRKMVAVIEPEEAPDLGTSKGLRFPVELLDEPLLDCEDCLRLEAEWERLAAYEQAYGGPADEADAVDDADSDRAAAGVSREGGVGVAPGGEPVGEEDGGGQGGNRDKEGEAGDTAAGGEQAEHREQTKEGEGERGEPTVNKRGKDEGGDAEEDNGDRREANGVPEPEESADADGEQEGDVGMKGEEEAEASWTEEDGGWLYEAYNWGGGTGGEPRSGLNASDAAGADERLGPEGAAGSPRNGTNAQGSAAEGTASDKMGVGGGGEPPPAEAGGGARVGDEGGFGFKLLEPASVAYEDVDVCTRWPEPAVGDFRPLHPGVNMLVVAGVQKGGTTWMANALMQHPDLVHATHGYRLTGMHTTKEVHYLDRWPHFPGSEAEYVGGFPAPAVRAATANATAQLREAGVDLGTLKRADGVRDAYTSLTHKVAFVDASPNYLPIAHAPPRASQIMPHARLVVVLRDPVARALSAYNMDRGRFCGTGKRAGFFLPETVCPDTAFADTVKATTEPDARGDLCAFDGLDKGGPHTWHDCYSCWHMFHNHTHCTQHEQDLPERGCRPAVLNYVQLSMYAPQLAWWLAFFPPEQILILTSAELHDPSTQVQALNRILDHARLPHARRFTQEWLNSMQVDGFSGSYKEGCDARGVDAAAATLRRRFRKPAEDLVRLVNRFWPHMNFTGLPDEV
eukprot:jgi/Ulvmu1/8878/UM049_0060.1